ncbi:hypothetical protein AAHB45_02295 [Pediococcus pentosaceus]|uniref:hypothetical protein n=1 Tax=Pediococcus pentosaceus TaxID=1255 RepID=UPI0031677B75
MKLVKIEDCYVNTDHIDLIREAEDGFGTSIFMSGSSIPWEANLPIKKVLDAICGSEEHLIECEDAENYRRDRKTIKDPY